MGCGKVKSSEWQCPRVPGSPADRASAPTTTAPRTSTHRTFVMTFVRCSLYTIPSIRHARWGEHAIHYVTEVRTPPRPASGVAIWDVCASTCTNTIFSPSTIAPRRRWFRLDLNRTRPPDILCRLHSCGSTARSAVCCLLSAVCCLLSAVCRRGGHALVDALTARRTSCQTWPCPSALAPSSPP